MCRRFTPDELNTMGQEAKNDVIYQMQDRLDKLEHDYENLIEQVRLADQQRFGRHTEKLDEIAGQLSFFNEAEANCDESSPEPTIDETVAAAMRPPRKPKKKGQRVEDLKDFPQEEVEHDVPREELTRAFGEGNWKSMPDEVFWQLRFEPARWIAEKPVVKVYVGTDGLHQDEFLRGDHPATLFRGSIATPSLEAAVINAKYVNSNPLDRIARDFQTNGLNLSRQTMSNWTVWSAERYFLPVYDLMKKRQLEAHVNQCDETPVAVVQDSRGGESRRNCYFWVFSTSELWPGERVVVFQYEGSRSTDVLREFLEGYSGTLTCDAYACYQTFEKEQGGAITVTGCMTHMRRNFVDALKAMRGFRGLPEEEKEEVPAYQAVKRLKEIFRLETPLRELSAEERLRIRQEKIAPKIEELFRWIHSFQEGDFDKGGLMQKALNYAKNQEEYLKRFLEDGYVPMHNSGSERSIIPFCIGRNNWKAIASVNGATAAAYAYSIAETAKANHADPFYYYKFLLEKLPPILKERGMEEDLSFLDCYMPWSEGYKAYEQEEKARYRQELQKLA